MVINPYQDNKKGENEWEEQLILRGIRKAPSQEIINSNQEKLSDAMSEYYSKNSIEDLKEKRLKELMEKRKELFSGFGKLNFIDYSQNEKEILEPSMKNKIIVFIYTENYRSELLKRFAEIIAVKNRKVKFVWASAKQFVKNIDNDDSNFPLTLCYENRKILGTLPIKSYGRIENINAQIIENKLKKEFGVEISGNDLEEENDKESSSRIIRR